ncbi:MAG: SDR family oxidoreductase [Bacillota bacterium]|nr:3-oxoacyl-ACP reductase FabG [Bacillota bacterium]TAH57095.1 MAG: SDR family oxidoreductase [Bacillota bacterium]
MGRLQGKVALITGAAKGLGQVMAETFAKEGAIVYAADMAPLSYTAKNVVGVTLNVTDVEMVKKVVADIKEKHGKIDVLVNNAGITADKLTVRMDDAMWDRVIAVNLKGVFNLVREVGPFMEQTGGGSIINISSVVGIYGNIGQANYAASKAGVIGMTKTWAKEFARKGVPVRVNAIAPGYMMTDILKTVPQDLLDSFAKLTMLGRLGEPEEIAGPALFLASDESSYVTGAVLEVNGGMRL